MTDHRLSTGIEGLDEVLLGGLIPRRTYMVRGPPGSGKTLLGFEFLSAGAEADEEVLFISLEETATDLRANAASVGLDLDDVPIVSLAPDTDVFAKDRGYDVFSPAEAEGRSMVADLTDHLEDHDPDRVVLDPVTQLRYLAPDDYQFRQQIAGEMRS